MVDLTALREEQVAKFNAIQQAIAEGEQKLNTLKQDLFRTEGAIVALDTVIKAETPTTEASAEES